MLIIVCCLWPVPIENRDDDVEVGAEVKGGDGVRLETYLCGKSKHGVCGGISHLLHYHFSARWTMLYGAVFIE